MRLHHLTPGGYLLVLSKDSVSRLATRLLVACAITAVPIFCQNTRQIEPNAGKWKTWEPLGHLGQDLAGRTLGVVGMGRIGYALARRCQRGWDMKVIYYDVQKLVVEDALELILYAQIAAFEGLQPFVKGYVPMGKTFGRGPQLRGVWIDK